MVRELLSGRIVGGYGAWDRGHVGLSGLTRSTEHPVVQQSHGVKSCTSINKEINIHIDIYTYICVHVFVYVCIQPQSHPISCTSHRLIAGAHFEKLGLS